MSCWKSGCSSFCMCNRFVQVSYNMRAVTRRAPYPHRHPSLTFTQVFIAICTHVVTLFLCCRSWSRKWWSGCGSRQQHLGRTSQRPRHHNRSKQGSKVGVLRLLCMSYCD